MGHPLGRDAFQTLIIERSANGQAELILDDTPLRDVVRFEIRDGVEAAPEVTITLRANVLITDID